MREDIVSCEAAPAHHLYWSAILYTTLSEFFEFSIEKYNSSAISFDELMSQTLCVALLYSTTLFQLSPPFVVYMSKHFVPDVEKGRFAHTSFPDFDFLRTILSIGLLLYGSGTILLSN